MITVNRMNTFKACDSNPRDLSNSNQVGLIKSPLIINLYMDKAYSFANRRLTYAVKGG